MAVNRKVTGKALSVPGGLFLGVGVSMALTLLISVILASLVNSEKLPWERIGYGIMGMVYISALIGALIAGAAVKHQRLLVYLLSGAVYWLTLLSLTALFFGGQYYGLGVTALVVFGGCGTVCLLGMRGEKKGLKRKRRPHTSTILGK